ncbi:MAG TPA: helix-turn-helix domain-containing protein [Stellaceae bacterium]|nr:helix-turn-helix domain-containing protein [Stellaceae bacterium]
MLRTGYREPERGIAAAMTIAVLEAPASEETELDMLDTFGSVLRLKRDATLFFDGDVASHYYKVVSGAVRSCKLLSDGRRHITDFFLAGDFIGVEALKTHSCTVEAVNDTTLVRYDRRMIDALVARSPRVGKFLLDRVCADLSAARARMLLLGRMSARERLASFVLRIGARSRRADCDTIPLPMTRSDIGDHLGLTTETVCRTFAHLKSAGLISAPSPHELRVLKRSDLAALAQGV